MDKLSTDYGDDAVNTYEKASKKMNYENNLNRNLQEYSSGSNGLNKIEAKRLIQAMYTTINKSNSQGDDLMTVIANEIKIFEKEAILSIIENKISEIKASILMKKAIADLWEQNGW